MKRRTEKRVVEEESTKHNPRKNRGPVQKNDECQDSRDTRVSEAPAHPTYSPMTKANAPFQRAWETAGVKEDRELPA